MYKYGWNHNLVICIHMTEGGGGGVYGARQNFRNEIHLTKILLHNKMNFAVVYHKMHYPLSAIGIDFIEDLSCLLHLFYQKLLTF